MDDILDQITTPEQLGALIDNLSPEDLNATVEAVGAREVLARVFQAMEGRFRPERANGTEGVALFRVSTPGGAVVLWRLTIEDGRARAAEGGVVSPTAKLSFGLADC